MSARFRLKGDGWREFRGYVFSFGKPTTVLDRATIEALTGHPDFQEVPDLEINGHHIPVAPARPKLTLPKRKAAKDNYL